MNFPTSFPAQHQDKHPGFESVMNPTPMIERMQNPTCATVGFSFK